MGHETTGERKAGKKRTESIGGVAVLPFCTNSFLPPNLCVFQGREGVIIQ